MSNILLISHIFPPAIDGGSKVIAKMGQYLNERCHHVLYISSDCQSTDDFVDPQSNHHISHQSSSYIRLPVYQNLRRPIKFFRLLFHLVDLSVFEKGPIFKLFPSILALIKIKQFKPDYVIAGPLPTTIVLYAKLFSTITHAKLVINASFHPTDPSFHNHLLVNTLKRSDYLWTLTNFETQYFHRHFDIPYSQMINIGNGVDRTLLIKKYSTIPSQKQNLLFIGSFSAHKGLETLIDAFILLRTNFPQLTLTLAGQPTLFFPRIQNKVNLLPHHLNTKIKIISDFPNSELPRLLDQTTVLISPSTQESFGLVLLEAWARGKPVIAADIPASVELINKSLGGLVFHQNNPDDLSKQIIKLINQPSLQLKYGHSGYQFVKANATWDKIGDKLWSKIS